MALPLNVVGSSTPAKERSPITAPKNISTSTAAGSRSATPVADSRPSAGLTTKPEDITSPHELTVFIESLLNQVETGFDDMSNQILERMTQMSSRVDSLELAVQDLINGDLSGPGPSLTPQPTGGSAQTMTGNSN
ncbi:Heat shock factor binding protein 1, partial [Rhizoctonia solani]